jgi:ATP adenylyltransferase/5',5'''-P-1,P-4-tetraphosphate phosphorylase II
MGDKVADCFLCFPAHRPIFAQNELAIALYDRHPVTPLHVLIAPRRHATTYFDLHDPERGAINLLLDEMRLKVLAEDKAVEGFNVGMNCGATAGQTLREQRLANLPVKFANSDEKSCNLKGEFAASELGQNSVPAALTAASLAGDCHAPGSMSSARSPPIGAVPSVRPPP